MAWATLDTITWVIEISTTLVLFLGIFFIINAIRRIEGQFKKPTTLLLIASLLFVLLGTFRGILVNNKVPYENFLWTVPSIIGFIGAIIFVNGARILLREAKKI